LGDHPLDKGKGMEYCVRKKKTKDVVCIISTNIAEERIHEIYNKNIKDDEEIVTSAGVLIKTEPVNLTKKPPVKKAKKKGKQ
jgi:hypothetical protein